MIQDQPPPTEGKTPVALQVIVDVLHLAGFRGDLDTGSAIEADICDRTTLGIERYGHPLETFNGRDARIDAYQEALDLQNYLKQLCMERPSDGRAKRLYWVAMGLVWDIKEYMQP